MTDFHPEAYHIGYNDDELESMIGAFMALHSDYSNAEKLNLYAAVVQQGIDFAGNAEVGNIFPANGGHGMFYKPFVVIAASALNASDLANVASTPGVFAEDVHFRYVDANQIDLEIFNFITTQNPRLGYEYQDVQLGLPERFFG
jgi:hypothetical protein